MDVPTPPLSPEVKSGGENLPNVTPEQAGIAAPVEAGKQAPQSAPVTPLPTDPTVAPQTQVAGSGPTIIGPAIADDVDVIEKEWVDQAEEVIQATKDDPYKEEEAVEDMQIDYMKKRYGKEINRSDENPAGS